MGCYHFVSGQWLAETCLTSRSNATEGGSYGVEGVNINIGKNDGRSLNQTLVKVLFTQFSGESDSNYGSNAWSIQDNTNFFTGFNGQTDWVQFTEQNNVPYSCYIFFTCYHAIVCVWNVDVTTQAYSSDCAVTASQAFSTSQNGFSVQGLQYYENDVSYLEAIFTGPGGGSWSVTTTDAYGLAELDEWSSISGTVLGLGEGSTAEFTTPVSQVTAVMAYPMLTSSCSGMSYGSDLVTAELNTLTPGTPALYCDPAADNIYYGLMDTAST